jgi:hypothetical protein
MPGACWVQPAMTSAPITSAAAPMMSVLDLIR